MSTHHQAPEHVPRDHEAPEPVHVDHAADAPYPFPDQTKTAKSHSRLLPDGEDAHYAPASSGGLREKKAGILGFLHPAQAGARHRKKGLSPRLFWILIAVVGLIVIGASIGGAVGGAQAVRNNDTSSVNAAAIGNVSTPASTSPATMTASATNTATIQSATSTPTLAVSYVCSNSLKYTPESRVGGGTLGAYTFQEHCDSNIIDGWDLAQSNVPTFEICMQSCTYWNEIWRGRPGSIPCTGAIFHDNGSCWIKNGTTLSSTSANQGYGAALVVSGFN